MIKTNAVLHDALTVIILASSFGLMGFLYSLIDLVQPAHQVIVVDPFKALTVQGIGGHFLYGFLAAAIAAGKNVKIGILVGLMALTIDADHILNMAKVSVQGRLDHSIVFAILSVPLIGLLATQIVQDKSNLPLTATDKNIADLTIIKVVQKIN